MSERDERQIPEASVARLPLYLRCLTSLTEAGIETVSSVRLAELAGVNAAKVRKDLSYLGSYGTRGVGYDVDYLQFQIRRELGLTQERPVVIVGLGNLGQALAHYAGFSNRGFPVVGLVDVDAAKVGTEVDGHVVAHLDDLEAVVHAGNASIGILSVPGPAAQDVADRMVAAGIRSILTFAPSVISVPPEVSLRKVDLALELQILSFYCEHGELGDGELAPITKVAG